MRHLVRQLGQTVWGSVLPSAPDSNDLSENCPHQRGTHSPNPETSVLTNARHVQARCRGELFMECSRLDDKVPVSHEEQMSTLRKVGSYACQAAYSTHACQSGMTEVWT